MDSMFGCHARDDLRHAQAMHGSSVLKMALKSLSICHREGTVTSF
jgi:hypothetical protein